MANVLIGLSWLGSTQIPTTFAAVLKLAEIGGIDSRRAREIYEQVEAATLGGWAMAAERAGVSPAMMALWQQGMDSQTAALRADAKQIQGGF